jgi:hypothetical protein
MINVSIFVYGDDGLAKRLELFEDENISINSSIQNINDISKVFTDFSQSFTIPATKTNNAIFKHWYENSLDSAFNATKRKDAYIEIDTLPFRKGKLQLEKASYKKGDIDNYTLTFFGSLISLKDKFNNRFLRDFDYSAYNFTYTGAIVKTRVTGNVGLDVKFPLISSKNVWQYNTNGTDVSNYDISKVGTPISYLDLFPAMRISKILESIATQIGITLSGSFLSNSKFTNAFLWLKNTDTFVQKGSDNRIYFQSKSSTTGTSDIFDLATNVLNFTQPLAPAYVSKNYIDIDFTSGSGITFNFSVYKNGIKVNEQTALTSPTGFPIRLDIAFVDSGAYTFFVSSTSALTFTSVYTFEINSGSGASIDVVATQSTPQTTTTTLNIGDYMPELKAEDFFSGLLKMFNLTCYSNDGITYYVEQLEEWYSAGQTYDISEYCQTDEIDLERVRPYKTFNFNYEECENLLATRFLSQSDIPYGDLKYEIDNDGEEYSIELPFENMPFTKFTDTNLQVGYSIKFDYSGYIPKPVILYDYGVIQTLTSPKTYYFDDGTSSATATTYNLFGQDTLVSSIVSTINWGAEQSTFTNKIEQNSLFQNYYSAYLTNTFNQKARLMKIKAILPIFLLSKLALNDKIVIRDKRYIINSYQTELTTGETSLELMSDFRNITLSATTTTTTATPTTSTTSTSTSTTSTSTTTTSTSTSTTSTTTTSTTTEAPRFTYFRFDVSSFDCSTSNPIPFWAYTSYADGFKIINGDGITRYLINGVHTNFTNQINSIVNSSCATTTTTTTTCPPYGTYLYEFCGGAPDFNKIGVFADGSCGEYQSVIAYNDPACGFTTTTSTTTTTLPPRYTFLRYDVNIEDCSIFNPIPFFATTNYTTGYYFVNGDGIIRYVQRATHSNFSNQINSVIATSCTTTTTSTTTCSPYGTYIREFCGGAPDYNKIGVFADGSCGEYQSVIAYNDPACGYTTTTTTTTAAPTTTTTTAAPTTTSTTTTTTTCTPYGTYIGEFCGGAPDFNKIGIFADGSCGTYNSVIAYNDPACGYTTTTTTTTTTAAPTTTTTTTAAPNCQQYTLINYDTEYSDYYDYQSCNGTWNYGVELGYLGTVTICARQGTVTAGGAISVSLPQGSCS